MDTLRDRLIRRDYNGLFDEISKMVGKLSTYHTGLFYSLQNEYKRPYKQSNFHGRVEKLVQEISSVQTVVGEALRVLMLCANPAGTTALKLREEHSQIAEQLQDTDVELLACFDADKTDLMREALEAKPHILHFSGHGSGKGLMMHNTQKNGYDLLTSEQASVLFAFLAQETPLQAVLLNACHTIEQAEAIREHVGCVVGTLVAIADAHACAFSTGFYMQLSISRDMATAFEAGKVRAVLEGAQASDFVML